MQMQIFSICFQVLNSGERIVQMVFIRFQYHLQRHFVVLVVARLVVDITIMQVPIATRRFVFIPMDLQDLSVGLLQVPNKQWGYGNSESTQTFPIKFTNSVIGIYGSKRAINYEYTFAATSITNTNFFMSTRNSEGNSRVIACNWLAIGQQQTK